MQRLLFLLLGLCVVTAPLARADDWSKTYTITGKPDLHVETSDAELHVDTWEQNTIAVHVTSMHYKIGEDGIRIIEHQNGDNVELEIRYPHMNFTVNFGSSHNRVNVDIHMPREGRVNLRTGDGGIRLANFKGTMDLESSDGHQEIDSVDGVLKARAGDGHIRASGRFDGLDVSTGDGRIEASVKPGSTVASGWNIRAGDGSVTLQLPPDFAADVDLHTSDGHIDLEMPVTVEGRLGEKNIHGKMNGGGNLLTVHTGDGSIRIERT
jgi:DUF4097 and DUF4098 domain-containing protein YvlB